MRQVLMYLCHSILLRIALLLISLFPQHAQAQYPPPPREQSVRVIQSPSDANVTIRFKTPPIGTCTTVFGTQKQFTGYVTIPPDVLRPSQLNYTINTFFWFIEARQLPETAPLTVFINGGPGSSSMVGLFQEVGPCKVVEVAQNKLGTIPREWGWDRSSNILFIDQPVQVGFSYDFLTNGSLNLMNDSVLFPPRSRPITQPDYTFLNGTFSSGNPSFTANTTQNAAQAVWHFLQAFLKTFPEYNPGTRPLTNSSSATAGINLFTESYGGKYGPAFGAFFKKQNTLRRTSAIFANKTLEITLKSLGIINGWVDLLVQAPFNPRFAYNNSCNIQAITQVQLLNALGAYSGTGGCQQLTSLCRAVERTNDPEDNGSVDLVNDACSKAGGYCQSQVIGPYTMSNRSAYDITQNYLDPFPDLYYLEYLNTQSVQEAIGVPINYTQDSSAVYSSFIQTGDYARNSILQDVVALLNDGVRVALIYGDRDYVCNWAGGEAISFAIAGAAGRPYLPWYTSGYAPIVANTSYVGGVVREYGNLSFSRIYDAGHLVPAYQPETAFTVFSRIIQGTDISLGKTSNLRSYGSFGDSNSTRLNKVPPAAKPTCYLRAVEATCDIDQKNMLANNAGVLINGVLYGSEDDWISPQANLSSMAGVPGTAPANMLSMLPTTTGRSGNSTSVASMSSITSTASLPTGVFTATGVPVSTSTTSSQATASKRSMVRQLYPRILLGFLTFGFVCGDNLRIT